MYAHLESTNVELGQTVAQGATIGVMGTTGRSTGIHIHFEVRKSGLLVNPMSVLK
ncbi:M23 family metallopeptidase [Sporosarcina sp. G11-34]|uniref:M23 family metallopeptidase n=1 Tax=Sporosarcina sp. G11-34 TaxID=2849605 RepID=UPI002E769F87|nr:M23 family metallopeptidase [Sporosarcina sp. G11-34]